MIRRLIRLLPLLCAMMLTGCIEFEEQTLVYRYDPQTDTLRIFQDYHGIFGGRGKATLEGDEAEELESVFKGQRTFFFMNWVFELNREQGIELMRDLKDPVKRKEAKEPEQMLQHAESLVQLLLDNVRIENGALYFDATQKLCGVQQVTITKFSKAIAAGNTLLQDFFVQQAKDANNSDAERNAFRKAAAGPPDVIKIRGNHLSFRMPMTQEDFTKQFGTDSDAAKQLLAFNRAGGKIVFLHDEVTFSVGDAMETRTVVTLPFSEKAYLPNAIEAVKKHAAIREKFDPQAAAKTFLNSIDADAKK